MHLSLLLITPVFDAGKDTATGSEAHRRPIAKPALVIGLPGFGALFGNIPDPDAFSGCRDILDPGRDEAPIWREAGVLDIAAGLLQRMHRPAAGSGFPHVDIATE